MLKIGMVVYPGFQPFGLTAMSVFEFANAQSDRPVYETMLVSEGGGPVRSCQGYSVDTVSFRRRAFDTLMVLGDNACGAAPDKLMDYLRAAPGQVRRVTSVCTGAFVLAEAGLLDGKRATTHWFYARDLAARFPGVTVEDDRIFVADGAIWTSAGMSAGIDLALALVEKDVGPDIAKAVARKLVLYHRRGGGQSQFSTLLELDAKSDRVQKALSHARNNLSSDLSVETLADVGGLSPRQFTRVFREETGQTPAKAIERLRVEAARLMLETSRHPIEVVARETGFGDRERMRQSFLRAFGQPPQSIQRSSADREFV
jgi:transcriptional regulator GlxA family with amidase domain